MATEICYSFKPQDQDLVNFQDDDALMADSDADDDDDRPHY